MNNIKIPTDASINVQNAFRDVEAIVHSLKNRIDNLQSGASRNDLELLRREMNSLLKSPTYRAWVDVFGANLVNTSGLVRYLRHTGVVMNPSWSALTSTDLLAARGDILRGGAVSGGFENYAKADAGWVLGYDADDVVALDRRVVMLGADRTSTSGTLADVTGLSFAVPANANYSFEFNVIFQTNSTNRGIALSLNGPASPTQIVFEKIIYSAIVTGGRAMARAYDDAAGTTGNVDAADQDCFALLRGTLRNGANAGTLIVRFALGGGIGGTTVKVMTGSNGRIKRL